MADSEPIHTTSNGMDRRAFLGGVATAALPLVYGASADMAMGDDPSAKSGRSFPGLISRQRNPSKTVRVAERARQFRNQTVTRAIYATGWDGTVRVVARATGSITVFREH